MRPLLGTPWQLLVPTDFLVHEVLQTEDMLHGGRLEGRGRDGTGSDAL